MSRTESERAPAPPSASERGGVPASGWSPGAGGGVRNEPRDKCRAGRRPRAGEAGGHSAAPAPRAGRPGPCTLVGAAGGRRAPDRARAGGPRAGQPPGRRVMADRINRSPLAPASYVSDFPMSDRLANLLAYAVACRVLRAAEANRIALHVQTAEAAAPNHAAEQDLEAEAC